MSGLKFQKPRPAALVRADRRRAITAIDAAGSQAVKARSGGQCEVVTVGGNWRDEVIAFLHTGQHPRGRCQRRAFHIHHMIGGHGKRGRGESAKAIRKQYVCPDHHEAIGNHTMRRVGGVVPHFTDAYERVR